jgi:hypothetical protein
MFHQMWEREMARASVNAVGDRLWMKLFYY